MVIGGTGGAGGAPLAEAARRRPARVAIVGRNADRGQERANKIVAAGGRAIFHAADAAGPRRVWPGFGTRSSAVRLGQRAGQCGRR